MSPTMCFGIWDLKSSYTSRTLYSSNHFLVFQVGKIQAPFTSLSPLPSSFTLLERKYRMRMKRRSCCLVVFFLQTFSLVSATSRTFASDDNTQQAGLLKKSQSSTLASDTKRLPDSTREMDVSKLIEEACEKELSRIGSSPPSCEHKCYGCTPCEAIQVPTTSRCSHWNLQYANYEPEGWKCQCGTSLYSP